MSDLIERLAKAAGPDRELDCLIWAMLNGYAVSYEANGFVRAHKNGAEDIRLGFVDPGVTERNFYTAGFPSSMTPTYTASIDAALLAGETGWEYSISTLYGIADVEIPLNDTTVDPINVRRKHGHVPTALCEAIMKANAPLTTGNRESRDG